MAKIIEQIITERLTFLKEQNAELFEAAKNSNSHNSLVDASDRMKRNAASIAELEMVLIVHGQKIYAP